MKARTGKTIQRLMNSMRETHAYALFIVFDTLTLADDRLEAVYDNPNALRYYFRDIGRIVLAEQIQLALHLLSILILLRRFFDQSHHVIAHRLLLHFVNEPFRFVEQRQTHAMLGAKAGEKDRVDLLRAKPGSFVQSRRQRRR